jgi:hypothetical protein
MKVEEVGSSVTLHWWRSPRLSKSFQLYFGHRQQGIRLISDLVGEHVVKFAFGVINRSYIAAWVMQRRFQRAVFLLTRVTAYYCFDCQTKLESWGRCFEFDFPDISELPFHFGACSKNRSGGSLE